MKLRSLLIVGSLFVSVSAQAVQIRDTFYTLRQKSMGGAITSAVDDYSTAIVNPANMAFLESGILNMGLGVSFNSAFPKFIEDLGDVATEQDNVQRAIKLNNFFNDYNGEVFTVNPYFYGMYSGTKWGFGFIPINTESQVSIYEGTAIDFSDSYLDIQSYLDGMFYLAYGSKYQDNLAWGINLKANYRGYFGETIYGNQIEDDELFKDSGAKYGLSLDADAGVTYILPKMKSVDAKLSAVVRNIVDKGFTINASKEGEPPKLQRRLDLGSEFRTPKFWVFTPRFTFDLKNIGYKDWDFKSGYHIGAELNWKVYDWMKGGYRVGLNQGYFTAGIDMRFAWFRLDLATWGDEVGTKSSRKELRRTALNMSLDF